MAAMERVHLTRYQDTGRLGSGADYEVRAAVDLDTGQEVVLKRPVPQMVSRQLHGQTEARTERTLAFYDAVGHTLSSMIPILGYTDPQVHDEYFGDSLGHEYRVVVEKRAEGIPLLVSDPRARITGVPVGVAQNLFALFPLRSGPADFLFAVHRQLLDLQESLVKAGYLLLDLGPQNIFFQPSSAGITVIDYGALQPVEGAPAARGGPPKDIHFFYLELLKYYTKAGQPPEEAGGYRDPHALRPVVRIEEELDEMGRGFDVAGGPPRDPALQLIDSVRGRAYQSPAEFRRDLTFYLDAVARCNSQFPPGSAVRKAWGEALGWLRGEYWQRFSFDADAELAGLVTQE